MKRRVWALIAVLGILLWPSLCTGWIEDGVTITYATFGQRYPKIAYTGGGNAIIVWEDDRNYYSEDTNIYAQRIDTTGVIHWVINGMPVCRADGVQETPKICPDATGGAYICWEDHRNGNIDVYLQHIGSDGLPLWDLDGIAVTTNSNDQFEPEILPDGFGGVIIVWTDGRDVMTTGYNVYAQRYDDDGIRFWNAGGNAVCDVDYYQGEPKAVSDGEGGAFVVWRDGRDAASGGDPNNLYMARMDASGIKRYENDLIVEDYAQTDPVIVPVGDGTYIVAWMDGRYPSESTNLYAQRVSSGGAKMWSIDGAPLCTEDETQYIYGGVSDDDGGAIYVWHDNRGVTTDLYISRIDSSAVKPWALNGLPLCAYSGSQLYAEIVPDGAGGAVVCWQDNRTGGDDIYAQRINSSGTLLWTSDGLVVCDEGSDQFYPALCSDGENGALITWMDMRVGDPDIFAALVTGIGDLVETLLQSYTARAEDDGIIIEWRLSHIDPNTSFSIERAEQPSGKFIGIEEPAIRIEDLQCTFEDATVLPGEEYQYAVLVSDDSGSRELFRTDILSVPLGRFSLDQNHPNPFNPATIIEYYLHESAPVTLEIYDVSGRLVARLLDGVMQEHGPHSEIWDGRDSSGREMASGVYLYRLESGKTMLSRKMLLLR
jgi:hypothetical protein